MKHRHDVQAEGLGEENFQEEWNTENKDVFMYSGCKDDQTSADATEDGQHVGAMSWAFLKTMEENPDQTYLEVLQSTRLILADSDYTQIPQLSVGSKIDLDVPLAI
ncbi:hypothetical protein FIBSPDRAFT_958077 [Athelia psychrophila]|nr:hypothetical protein FIBSPDRAFT_958077 [Fibularhizoctonia sp. CBS 109695]